MTQPQIARLHIADKDFTLYYDYDQLRDGKLTGLPDDAKIEWFQCRMNFVFLEPLSLLYKGKTQAYRALNSTTKDDLPARSFVIPSFSVLLNGVEALGSFTIPQGQPQGQNRKNFCAFIGKYMKSWDKNIQGIGDLKKILWDHFRNGIAHGFRIKGGGIDNEADTAPGWRVVPGPGPVGSTTKFLQIGPNAFFGDFQAGVGRFFDAVKTDPAAKRTFLHRFEKVYPS